MSEQPFRGVQDVVYAPVGDKVRRYIRWTLGAGERMTEIIVGAAGMYEACFGQAARIVLVRQLPGQMSELFLPWRDTELLVLAAEWVPEKCALAGFHYVDRGGDACFRSRQGRHDPIKTGASPTPDPSPNMRLENGAVFGEGEIRS